MLQDSYIRTKEDVRADISEPVGGNQNLHKLKASVMELSFQLGLPHHEMLWSKESQCFRYQVTAKKVGDKIQAHIWDTITGAQYEDEV